MIAKASPYLCVRQRVYFNASGLRESRCHGGDARASDEQLSVRHGAKQGKWAPRLRDVTLPSLKMKPRVPLLSDYDGTLSPSTSIQVGPSKEVLEAPTAARGKT